VAAVPGAPGYDTDQCAVLLTCLDGVGPMKTSVHTNPEMLRREADECMELLTRATFTGIIAVLMEHADTCRALADRIAEEQRRQFEHR
jgi:hypothetical protein